ncbi:MAG: flagellar hook assembly protein FlgD [Desulfobacterales bacterium]|jgi:flagellar basal-body rod modification protein FlgD|nr:flagellar hook assembly protein FlgD [Desulfobacterales bacterium]
MTTITPLDSNANSGDAQSSAPVKIMGKDDFLNMLIAQLQHQDPLNPTDGTEFTAQLAQFSSLEQLSNINDSLQNMEQFQASLIDSQAVSYIGKEITAKGNSVQLESGRPVECHFELGANAALAVISVYDASGGFVKSFETGPLNSGRQSAAWDGTDNNGNSASAGLYRFEVQALDAENQSLSVTPLISSVVTGVSFKNQTVSLITGLQTVAIDDVIEVSEATAPAATVATNSETNSNEQPNGGN